MINYQELVEKTLQLKARPEVSKPQEKENSDGPGYKPGDRESSVKDPDYKRKYGWKRPDENEKHPNEGKKFDDGYHREYHAGWEIKHMNHAEKRQSEGRSGAVHSLPGKFKTREENNKDFSHRMIRGVLHSGLKHETEVRFKSDEHNHTVVANVHPGNKQIRIMTVLPKERHGKGENSNKDRQITIESTDELNSSYVIIDLDESTFQDNFEQFLEEECGTTFVELHEVYKQL